MKHTIYTDILFGIIIPFVCLVLDPVIFRGVAVFGWLQIFAYLAIGVCMVTLALWLWRRIQSPIVIGLMAGIFFIGSILAVVMGLPLALASVISFLLNVVAVQIIAPVRDLASPPILIPPIGLAVLSWFVTPFVYFRHARIATQHARTQIQRSFFIGLIGLSIVLVLGVPALLQIATSKLTAHLINTIVYGDEAEMQQAITRLQTIPFRLSAPQCSSDMTAHFVNAIVYGNEAAITRLHAVTVWFPSTRCSSMVGREIAWMGAGEPGYWNCDRLADAYHAVTGSDIRDAYSWIGSDCQMGGCCH